MTPISVSHEPPCRLRTASLADARRLLDIYSYYVTDTAISFELSVPSLPEFEHRIAATLEKYPYIVAEDPLSGVLLGYAYAGPFHPRAAYAHCAEVTIYLDHGCQKRGLGRKLYDALEEELRSMGIRNLYACIGYPEAPDEYLTTNSADFHAHMGYTLAGRFHKCGRKFCRWYDMIWMEKLIA